MKIEMRGRDRRALVLLGLAVAVYLAMTELALPAYDRIRSEAGTVASKEDELRKYRGALVSQQHYTQLLDQVKKSLDDGESRLVRGDNASLASVELQTIVEDAEKKFNIPVGSKSMSAAKKKDDYFNEISMTLSFDSTPNQLTSFLAELRSAPKFVTVKSLQVAPVQLAQEAPAKGELKKTVRVALTVSAVLAIPPTAAQAGTKG